MKSEWYVIKKRGQYAAVNYEPDGKSVAEFMTHAGAIDWIEAREERRAKIMRHALDALGASAFIAALVLLMTFSGCATAPAEKVTIQEFRSDGLLYVYECREIDVIGEGS